MKMMGNSKLRKVSIRAKGQSIKWRDKNEWR